MGIDYEVFTDIHASLKCPVCLDVLDDPATAHCGHTCCYSCWFSIGRSSLETPKQVTCPMCRRKYHAQGILSFSSFIILMTGGPLFSNLIAKQLIDDSKTKCHWPGCKENIKYSERKRHSTECKHATLPKLRYLRTVRAEEEIVVQTCPMIEFGGCEECNLGFMSTAILRDHLIAVHGADESLILNL